MSSAYSFTGGSLRLKGNATSTTQGGKVSKKHKHKSKSSKVIEAPSSKMEHVASTISSNPIDQHGPSGSGSSRRDLRTPAEIAYDEAMAKRAEEKILRKAAKSHKEQVEELNSYLDKLTEYNDIPKIFKKMTRSMDDDFTYFVKILDDNSDRYYLKSSIDERTNTILMQLTNLKVGWIGTLNQNQVRALAKKFPPEEHDTFYSHTQRAFSKGNHSEIDGRTYVFTCKIIEKNRLEFVWKQMVDDLNSLKIIGSAELQERPIEEILVKMMDHAIDEMETLRSTNEQKIFEIQRINGQLNKALETVKQTVDTKEKLEADLYRKNKTEIRKRKFR
ncbi:unnamed protein product [Rotaria socialis]|uniref:XRCC4 N-terminal domain-containing protein n=2 Tax=Rotaria socialis TaxID=392032 RepID=A0A817W3A1_9BILA|nr:unnamed protein product [Rotaria socialis]CAF3351126.1 unnamed protein product [Rotaria socialis]CAF3427254.1 unnamed protein product [Rotaria socialis]CAF3430344.1 unnamed protein product [Rotaria socialis]CAF3796167.1 unnamed protein product [Rotaria socialis]